MKLRNKKTGEIKEWDFGNWYQAILNPDNKPKYECNLIEFIDRAVKFGEDWEDYEEPKEYKPPKHGAWSLELASWDSYGNCIEEASISLSRQEYQELFKKFVLKYGGEE